LVICTRVRSSASILPGSKGGEANQDVRGRMDCQEEMLAAIYESFIATC